MVDEASITQIDLEYMLVHETIQPKALPLPLLLEITDGFSDKLEIGRGGFASVYKATLENGSVAVKKLFNTHTHEQEFQREVECLMKVKHKNIVRFLGYCADTQGNMADYNGKLVMADVRQRLLCFEYLPKGSLDAYMMDLLRELEWSECYQIIKGICDGLNYLHQNNILHLDLKPGNILLDEDMMPKIADFGLARCFEANQTRFITDNVGGTMGYLAPEFPSGEITHKFDLYSVGAIIMEMLTGKKGYQTVENVLQIWNNQTVDTLQWEQIRVCATIGIECIEADPTKRPASMKHIIDRLAEIECRTHVNPTGVTRELLVHQFLLCFPFEPNKVITCPLHITNTTDKHIAFRLMDKSMESSFLRLPLYGSVPPNTPYTLIVTTEEKVEKPRKYIIDVILHSATLKHVNTFQSHPEKFFQEMENTVQEVKLKALYTLPRDITTASSSTPTSPTIKIIPKVKDLGQYSLDTNQAKQWIMIGEGNGYVGFWDYHTQKKVDSLKIPATKVRCVKFIERKEWIVVGTADDGYLHVYDYERMQKITSVRVLTTNVGDLFSLAVHPTQPYLLSAGAENMMRLWDWDKSWQCMQTFEAEYRLKNYTKIYLLSFGPNGTFASASTTKENHPKYERGHNGMPRILYTVMVWSLDSPESKYSLPGRSIKVNCLDFFTCHDQEFLVTGSDDHTTKIWNLQNKICAYTLEAFISPVTSILYQQDLQTLIVGSQDGDIYLWSTTNCRTSSCPPALTGIIKIGFVGAANHLACLMGNIVIGKKNEVAILDINNVNCQEQSADYDKQQLNADTREHAGDTMFKQEIPGSISKLYILDVHPLELWFPYHPNEPISCSLDLTNSTDENMAFRLLDKSGKSPWCFTKLPLYGFVPRRSSYTLIVTMKEEMKLKEKKDFDLVIQSSLLRDKHTMVFQNQSECDQFFEEAEEFGNPVHEVILEAVYLQDKVITSEQRITSLPNKTNLVGLFARAWEWFVQPKDQNILVKYNPDDLQSIDAHPTKPWILTGHSSGYACVWNHEMKYPMNSFEVSGCAVRSAKFIARKEWIAAMTHSGSLLLYDCACVTEIRNIARIDHPNHPPRTEMAIHPTLPYVLMWAPTALLFDWDLDWGRIGWKHKRAFPAYYGVMAVAFNPGDHNRFAAGYSDGVVQIWRLDAPSTLYVEREEYTLRGHKGTVGTLDFIRRGDHYYLASGGEDGTAKIWDLQKRKCIYTMQAMSPVCCVFAHPKLPLLITGTQHGIIQIWSSADFRLKRIINLGGGGPVVGLACLMGSQRIVIGQEKALCSLEIRDNEALCPKSRKRGNKDQQDHVLAERADAEPSQIRAEGHNTEERDATKEQQLLQSVSVIESECSQATADHREIEKVTANHTASNSQANCIISFCETLIF